jgi:serine/threonine-protein kinase RsbW
VERGEGDGAIADDGDSRVVRLTIPAKAEYIVLGRLALSSLARLQPLTDEELSDLKLALTEACSNSVRHAYADRPGVVEIVYELHTDRVAIEVADDGVGFRPELEDDETDELDEGGLGLAIIRALSDELEIGERNGGGSRIRFVKLLAG